MPSVHVEAEAFQTGGMRDQGQLPVFMVHCQAPARFYVRSRHLALRTPHYTHRRRVPGACPTPRPLEAREESQPATVHQSSPRKKHSSGYTVIAASGRKGRTMSQGSTAHPAPSQSRPRVAEVAESLFAPGNQRLHARTRAPRQRPLLTLLLLQRELSRLILLEATVSLQLEEDILCFLLVSTLQRHEVFAVHRSILRKESLQASQAIERSRPHVGQAGASSSRARSDSTQPW